MSEEVLAMETLDQIVAALQGLQALNEQLQRQQLVLQERQVRLEEGQQKLEQRQLQLEMRHECLLGKVADHDVQLRSLRDMFAPPRRTLAPTPRRGAPRTP
ncbi:MAG: hypothetical protein AB1503_07550 [Bacillota bacterium]|nr:hypothetical protein [Bacillota bacterium]